MSNGTSFWRTQRLLGSQLVKRQQSIVLEIGQDRWTLQQLVDDVHCGHVQAARGLSEALRPLRPRSALELAASLTIEDLLRLDRVGPTKAYVWFCILDTLNLDPVKWLDRGEEEIVTLDTEKRRSLKAAAEKSKGRPRKGTQKRAALNTSQTRKRKTMQK